ncbi:DmsC/YnfH family molybdoenzyme membrane anchor subunit [Aquihabitans sp. McL0605]|uniref:DmsC/YnfH family molybdoenzyme membrane anchor subunit n=1 Tax=Aquihabitans sp. McL0605 TaxID=3415671 RepID=UPI003CEDED85
MTAVLTEPTPIDTWLLRQQDLSAVERFSASHDQMEAHGVAVPQGRWRDRLPATAPGPGQQYAFEVDLDSCTGCKACVAACHNLNGLDEGESWRRVGSLHDAGAGPGPAGSVTVTSACHHCVDPACMKGCPAQAYEKDPVTGIVRHLDDACIGCSYCTLTCPYEVPVFNQSLGIVRKCDLCSDRLAEGEAPACVQGCPQGAITITLASVDDLIAAAAAPDAALVPTAPRSDLTVPATAYVSRKPVPATWVAADRSSVHPSHGHTPLAVMLVLTQAAVGMTVAAAWLRATGRLDGSGPGTLGSVGLVTGLVAMGASVLHLGRPMLAWRAILGLRRSWLSREILAFGTFAGAGVATTAAHVLGLPTLLVDGAQAATVAGGVAGVACSVQLYAVTGRRWWRARTSGPRFAGTAVTCGALATAAVLALSDPAAAEPLLPLLTAIAIAGLAVSVAAPLLPLVALDRRRGSGVDELRTTRRLLGHQLQARLALRLGAAAAALVLLAVAAAATDSLADGSLRVGVALVLATVVTGLGEYHDHRLFFLASVAPRMPGSPR